MKKKYLILVILLVSLTGCIGFLVPKNDNTKGCLIIKTEFKDETDGDFYTFGHERLCAYSNGKEYTVDIQTAEGYTIESFLPPGTYTNWKVRFIYDNGHNYSQTWNLSEKVEIKPGAITIFPSKIVFNFYKGKHNGYDSIYLKTIPEKLTELETQKITEELKKDDNFFTWKSLYFADQPIIRYIRKTAKN